MVQVIFESIDKTEVGRFSDVAEVARLADVDLARGVDPLCIALGASESALVALMTSPSQPEDSASVTSERDVARRIAA